MAGQMSNAMNQPQQGSGAGTATVKCPKCGATHTGSGKFCNECGSKQEKPKCPNCQAEAAPGAKFCNECGTKIEGEAQPPAAS